MKQIKPRSCPLRHLPPSVEQPNKRPGVSSGPQQKQLLGGVHALLGYQGRITRREGGPRWNWERNASSRAGTDRPEAAGGRSGRLSLALLSPLRPIEALAQRLLRRGVPLVLVMARLLQSTSWGIRFAGWGFRAEGLCRGAKDHTGM